MKTHKGAAKRFRVTGRFMITPLGESAGNSAFLGHLSPLRRERCRGHSVAFRPSDNSTRISVLSSENRFYEKGNRPCTV